MIKFCTKQLFCDCTICDPFLLLTSSPCRTRPFVWPSESVWVLALRQCMEASTLLGGRIWYRSGLKHLITCVIHTHSTLNELVPTTRLVPALFNNSFWLTNNTELLHWRKSIFWVLEFDKFFILFLLMEKHLFHLVWVFDQIRRLELYFVRPEFFLAFWKIKIKLTYP